MPDDKLAISVVVPVYSGRRWLRELVERVEQVGRQWDADGSRLRLHEIVLVDDAAVDGSPDLADALAAERPLVCALHLSRNFGQHPATVAGICHSTGDWILTLDEDLQHPPELFDQLLARAAATGADVVYGRPDGALHGTWYRDLGSQGFKRLMAILLGDAHVVRFASFRLLRGTVARGAARVLSYEAYFDMALSWFTQRVETVQLPLRDTREAAGGKSGYTIRRLVSHARRMFVSAHTRVLRFGAAVGGVSAVLAFAAALVLGTIELVAPGAITVRGWPSIIVSVSFFGGLNVLLIGFLLEYVSILLLRAHGKPTFFVVDRSRDWLLREHFADLTTAP